MTDSRTATCPVCGGRMMRDERPDRITYKDRTAEVLQPGWYCTACDEALLDPADIAATEAAFIDLKARAEGLVTAPEIRRIRKSLKLTQRAAGEILGGGPRAFQKYEARTVMISRSMSNLLRLLDRHPEALDELRGRDGPA